MTTIDFLALQTRLSGYKLIVLANRCGCDTDFARGVHDTLLSKLDGIIAICRDCAQVERARNLSADPARQRDLEQAFGDILSDLEASGGGDETVPLLENIVIDRVYGQYFHPVFAVWCNFRGSYPAALQVSDEELCGLRAIIDRIADDTGFRFTVYQSDRPAPILQQDDIDPECYEDLHGFDNGNELSAIYALRHGNDHG